MKWNLRKASFSLALFVIKTYFLSKNLKAILKSLWEDW
jgi:hypothetical protein